ncbi:transposase [Pseudoalteromonas sp. CO325X]|uniref:transposase n=1 Tax=Pseudoalteromonas sp. CO325X TaxID=1777262 RepID=UPI0013EE8C18|nr:transposase [Pseudoalteromonas sp. CO325X]
MNKYYSNKLKVSAIQQVTQFNRSVIDVAKELRVSPSTLYSWINVDKELKMKSKRMFINKKLEDNLNKALNDKNVLIQAIHILACELGNKN